MCTLHVLFFYSDFEIIIEVSTIKNEMLLYNKIIIITVIITIATVANNDNNFCIKKFWARFQALHITTS